MALKRYFVGWDKPAAEAVSTYILPTKITTAVDLSGKVIVTPTRLAGRRLKEALLQKCTEKGVALLSCRTVTPPFFIRDDEPGVASEMAVSAAWVTVLRSIALADYPELFPVPFKQDIKWALATGRMLQALRRTLSDGGYQIADIDKDGMNGEPGRWHDLARLDAVYLTEIRRRGYKDPFIARLEKSHDHLMPDDINEIILAAVPDPTPLMVSGLIRVADKLSITVLVHAPAAMADYFDEWGRPITVRWQQYQIDIPSPESNIILTESPAAESRKVIDLITAESRQYGARDIAIGIPDAEVAPYLAADLTARGVPVFDRAGEKLGEHPVFTAVEAFINLVNDGKYADFASCLRHPDILDLLKAKNELSPYKLLEELDNFQNQYLPVKFDDFAERLLDKATGQAKNLRDFGNLAMAVEFIRDLASSLNTRDFVTGIRALLNKVYGVKSLQPDREEDARFVAAAREMNAGLDELEGITNSLIHFDRNEAGEIFLDILRQRLYYREPGKTAINLEGWLELFWSNAPFLLVAGMNEGAVPAGRSSDAFLPDSLKRRLGIKCNDDFLARDAYLMADMIAARRSDGRISFILAKTSQDGEPLKPSRLLFRCPDDELAARAKTLFGETPSIKQNFADTISFKLDPRLPPDTPKEALHLKQISVTSFKTYLACPFRFYLSQVLGMEELSDGKAEMDAMDFGSLIHHALHRMAGNPAIKNSGDAKKLSDFLCNEAEDWVKWNYGASYPLHIGLQLDTAKARLAAAAKAQAELVSEGWEIIEAERKIQAEIGGILVKGRIDRIDRNRHDGRIRLYDYKTADKADNPADTHLGTVKENAAPYLIVNVGGKARQWKDLQLPLYRILLPEGQFNGPIEAGYFNLPKALNDTDFEGWEGLDDGLIKSARECVAGVIEDIKALRFWPPADKVQYDDFLELFPGATADYVDGEKYQAYLEEERKHAAGL